MTLVEMIKVMQAFNEGEEIEVNINHKNVWFKTTKPHWNWECCDYRVKSKPSRHDMVDDLVKKIKDKDRKINSLSCSLIAMGERLMATEERIKRIERLVCCQWDGKDNSWLESSCGVNQYSTSVDFKEVREWSYCPYCGKPLLIEEDE